MLPRHIAPHYRYFPCQVPPGPVRAPDGCRAMVDVEPGATGRILGVAWTWATVITILDIEWDGIGTGGRQVRPCLLDWHCLPYRVAADGVSLRALCSRNPKAPSQTTNTSHLSATLPVGGLGR